MKKCDFLMVGIGGQGTVLASDVLGEVAMSAGYDVKKTDTLGMAQRGGSVVSHVRIAERVWSPLIKQGAADVLVAFEKLEALRWCYFLRPDGIAIINNQATPPLSVSLGLNRYPEDAEIIDAFRKVTGNIHVIEGTRTAIEMGEPRVLNMFMLGCISRLLPVEPRLWKECIAQRVPKKVLDINLAAFDRGREETSHVNLG